MLNHKNLFNKRSLLPLNTMISGLIVCMSNNNNVIVTKSTIIIAFIEKKSTFRDLAR